MDYYEYFQGLSTGNILHKTAKGTEYKFDYICKNGNIRYRFNANTKYITKALIECFSKYVEQHNGTVPSRKEFKLWCKEHCFTDCDRELKNAPCNYSVLKNAGLQH